jgi:Outer membrane lipoprotein carrier protein LolA-like
MISGILVLVPALLAASQPAPSTPTPDSAALIARLARPAPADKAYREVRFVSLLKQPLVLDGELHYGGDGNLGKRVDAPYHETTTISAGRVEVERTGKRPQHFALERAPELQALLAAFSALLGGDAATLAQYYRIDAAEDGADFTLTLTPRRADLARHLDRVVVDGHGDEPRCFSFQQRDGDSSVMLLGALAAAALPEAPSPAALAALCRSAHP